MRPKPTREWVMQELERLGVRVVSGRLGRKAGEEDEPETPTKAPGKFKLLGSCQREKKKKSCRLKAKT